jgi:replicative DNA helicase
MPKIRTLTVDLENPERIIRRTSTSIVGAARSMGYERNGDIHLVIKPDGLNLLSVADRMILEEHIETVQPDLLVMGPLYKAFLDPGTRTSEAVAIEVAKYLDRIRAVYGVALWLEHHAPLGQSMTSRELRPFGSAVWSRWPEFGLALQPDPTAHSEYVYDVNHFRGARDIRAWPLQMKRGKKFPFEVLEFMKV